MSVSKSNVKLYKREHQLINHMMDILSAIDRRHENIPEIEYEDLSERISGLITDLSWLTDYSAAIPNPEDSLQYED